MVHSMPLKNVSGQSYKATIRTFGSSLVRQVCPVCYDIDNHRKIPKSNTLPSGILFRSSLFLKYLFACFDQTHTRVMLVLSPDATQ